MSVCLSAGQSLSDLSCLIPICLLSDRVHASCLAVWLRVILILIWSSERWIKAEEVERTIIQKVRWNRRRWVGEWFRRCKVSAAGKISLQMMIYSDVTPACITSSSYIMTQTQLWYALQMRTSQTKQHLSLCLHYDVDTVLVCTSKVWFLTHFGTCDLQSYFACCRWSILNWQSFKLCTVKSHF